MPNIHKLFVSFLLIFCLLFAPVPGWQRPAEAFWQWLVAPIVWVTMDFIKNQTNQPVEIPREAYQRRETGYGLVVSADRANPELLADGESNMKVRVLVKNDGQIINGLPPGLKLFASHSNNTAELVQINSADEDYAAAGSGSLSFTKILPRYGATGRIRSLEYYIDPVYYPDMVSVTLKIFKKAAGELVYSRTESEPLNSSLKPFYWDGKTTGGGGLPPGDYAAELELLKSNGEKMLSPRTDLYINRAIGTTAENLPYAGVNTYLLLTAPESVAGTASDTVNVLLKDLSAGRTAAEGRVDFTFRPSVSRPAVAENRPTFSSSLRNEVDGVPVKVEIPAASGEILRVTVFDNLPADKVQYDYNLKTRNVAMSSATGLRTYGPGNVNDRAAYYSILRIMEDMIRSVYAESGLKFDVNTKQLTIDKSKYVDKIDPTYNVSASTSGNIVTMTISKGPKTVTCNYDLLAGTVSLNEEIFFADNYDWDYQAGEIVASGGVSAAAAEGRTSAAGQTLIPKIVSFPVNLMNSLTFVAAQLTVMSADINTLLQPMPHLEEPEISDINWHDKAAGLVSISGTAMVERASEMKVFVNNIELADYVAWRGGSWSVVNYSRPVQAGRDNKVNVIVRKADGREAESGDATVYIGLAGQPDLILLSPRDRQVVASVNVPVCEFDLRVSGRASPNASISLLNKTVTADASGLFSQAIRVDSGSGQREGGNNVPVVVTGSGTVAIGKTLIGAYKLVVDGKPGAYIIRKGDLMFNGKSGAGELFDWIIYDPDHAGIYVGNGQVAEAVWNEVKLTPIANWKNAGFCAATQFPGLMDAARREKVAAKVRAQTGKGYRYDIPISLDRQDAFRFSLKGHYDGPGSNNRFYCSELAYWAWETVAKEDGFDLRTKLEDAMYPARGSRDVENNSILPAYLCEKTMLVRSVKK